MPNTTKLRPKIYTIGHSTLPLEDFLRILEAHGITRLVDIRSFPNSRTNPQFNSVPFQASLEEAGIQYTLLLGLGGRRPKSKSVPDALNAGWERRPFHNYADYAQSSEFQVALEQLLALADNDVCALMCSEAVWWRCHRRIVTDFLLARGIPVLHLFTTTKSVPATLTPFAVVGPDQRLTYPETT